MGSYTQAFVVPRATRDRVLFHAPTYRQESFFDYYENADKFMSASGGLFVPDYNSDRHVRVVTPERWVEITAKFRTDFERDFPFDCRKQDSKGRWQREPMYTDDVTEWLYAERMRAVSWADLEVVLTEET